MEPRSILKKDASKRKALKVRHSLTKTITPVLRQNRKTGTIIFKDPNTNNFIDPNLFDFDDLFNPKVKIEEQISPPSSPGSPVDIETPIMPSPELLRKQQIMAQKIKEIKETYIPIMVLFMVRPNEEPQFIDKDFNKYFIDYLKNQDPSITIKKNTRIDVLEHFIITMFETPEINKDVVGCEFYRIDDEGKKIVFDRDNKNTLETYSELIESPSSTNPHKFNYFYINVYLQDMPMPPPLPPKGGSRKNKTNRKRKTNRKKKTNRR